MPQLIITTPTGEIRELSADANITAMVAIRDAGIEGLLALCGGLCSCATCHVHVAPECMSMLSPMGADEDELLDSLSSRDAYSRLSCQISLNPALNGLRLTVAGDN